MPKTDELNLPMFIKARREKYTAALLGKEVAVLQIKAQKTQADIQLDQAKLELEKEKLASHERIEGVRIGSKTTIDKNRLEGDQMLQGARLGMEAEFKKKEMHHKKQEMVVNATDKLMDHGHKHADRQVQKELSQLKPQE